MNKNKFIRILGLAFALIFGISVVDMVFFVPLHLQIGEVLAFPSVPSSLAIGLFWTLAVLIGLGVSATYYICLKDKSETIGILFTYLFGAIAGWEDIFYYISKGQSVLGMQLPDLKANVFINTISNGLGASVPTGGTLVASALAGLGIILVVDYVLLKIDWGRK